MQPILQITLNFLELDSAINAAKNAVINAEWIGIGNSLIKCKGIEAIGRIKEEFLDKKIVADMMVMDSSAEVEIASRAGADIITVSGMSYDSILLACVNAGRINGTEIIADLKNLNNAKDRAEVLEKLGVDYLLLDYKNIEEISDIVQIPIVAACPMDKEAIAYAVESGAGIVELRINNENDLRRFTRIKRAIQGGGSSLFPFYKDTPTREEFETITKEIDSIKEILADIEIRRRADAEKRKRLDEAEKLDEQRRKIAEEWRKLKEAEIRWEKKIKEKNEEEQGGTRGELGLIRARSALMDEEEHRMWREHDHNEERELRRIEDEWGKIKRAEEVIENQRRKIADEMRKIEQEWRDIEKMTGEIEKKEGIGNVEKKVGERKEIIGESPMNMEIEGIEMHTERNIEDDLLRIKEEHKKRKEEPKILVRHRTS